MNTSREEFPRTGTTATTLTSGLGVKMLEIYYTTEQRILDFYEGGIGVWSRVYFTVTVSPFRLSSLNGLRGLVRPVRGTFGRKVGLGSIIETRTWGNGTDWFGAV